MFIGFESTPFAKFFAILVYVTDFPTLQLSAFASAVHAITELFADGERKILEERVLIRSANITVQVIKILRAILACANKWSQLTERKVDFFVVTTGIVFVPTAVSEINVSLDPDF